jgi:hypothetical protein
MKTAISIIALFLGLIDTLIGMLGMYFGMSEAKSDHWVLRGILFFMLYLLTQDIIREEEKEK